MTLQNRWLRAASWTLAAAVFIAIFVGIFQVAVRYRYESLSGLLWRVDLLTGQRCRVIDNDDDCTTRPSSSTSTSTSLSVSTSLSARAVSIHRH